MAARIGIDVGGTFTDLFLLYEATGAARTAKVLNRHADRSETVAGAIAALVEEAGLSPEAVSRISHGTTITTNAVIERRGARTALLTNHGFRDILEIGRFARPAPLIYRIDAVRPPPLVPRRLRLGVPGRIDRTGAEIVPLDAAGLEAAIDVIEGAGVEAVAVAFLFSFLNPAHEIAAGRRIAERLPGVEVILSHEAMPEFREFPRTSTAVFSAYVAPVLRRYLTGLTRRLEEAATCAPLYVFQSNGGAARPEIVLRNPAQTLLSGPAGAVVGAARICGEAGFSDLVTMDIGGTSLDVCVVKGGRAETTTAREIDFFPVALPMLDIHTVGAGGGSVVKVDEVGRVKVGPESQGADPGPAAYGRGGTEATLTDVNLVLGFIDPEGFAGGTVALDLERARRAVEANVAKPLGLPPEAAAAGVFRVAASQMAEAVRLVTVERGLDPRDFALVAFGGGGPLHAAAVARKLGMAEVVVPRDPGVFSAHGIARSDVRHAYARPLLRQLMDCGAGEIAAAAEALAAAAHADLAAEDVAADARTLAFALDMRYRGQSTEIPVPLPAGASPAEAERLFHAAHERLYGYAVPGEPVEVVTARLEATGHVAMPPLPPLSGEGARAAARRRVFLPETGEAADIPVLDRAALRPGDAVDGPALLAEASSTTVIPPGAHARVEPAGNLVIRVFP